jgi:hypothetical protein
LDGRLGMPSRVFEDLFGEGSWMGGRSEQDVGFDVFDDGKELHVIGIGEFKVISSVLNFGAGRE